MNKVRIIFLIFATPFVHLETGWAAMNQIHPGTHNVSIYHPLHGSMSMPVQESEVNAHRPAGIPREGVTGRRVGCNLYGIGC